MFKTNDIFWHRRIGKKKFLESPQIRHEGGGRKLTVQSFSAIDEVFLKVITDHIAGDPMNPNIRWVKLTRAEISMQMKQLGVSVSRNIIKKLMKKHRLVKRKMQRKRSIGKSADREQQFKNIIAEKEKFMTSDNPIISVDTKKKEQVGGNLHRDGSVYCTQAIEVSDHDYAHLADLKIAPHGIYDMKQNKAYVNIGISAETAEFVCDSGGANSYRHHIFKSKVQKLVNEINIPLKIVHYPPYTSKWNPIEHRVFPHVTRTLAGVPLNTVDEAINRIESAKTKTGLTVTANVIQKTYETGKKAAKDFMKNLKIKFGESVPKLNYTISPIGGVEISLC